MRRPTRNSSHLTTNSTHRLFPPPALTETTPSSLADLNNIMSSFLSSRKKQAARKTSSATVNNHVPRDPLRERLNRLFDQYKGTELRPGTNEVDKLDVSSSEDIMNIEGTMSYFQAIGLDPDDPVGLALAYQLDAPSLGVFNRHGFVEGWRNLRYVYFSP